MQTSTSSNITLADGVGHTFALLSRTGAAPFHKTHDDDRAADTAPPDKGMAIPDVACAEHWLRHITSGPTGTTGDSPNRHSPSYLLSSSPLDISSPDCRSYGRSGI